MLGWFWGALAAISSQTEAHRHTHTRSSPTKQRKTYTETHGPNHPTWWSAIFHFGDFVSRVPVCIVWLFVENVCVCRYLNIERKHADAIKFCEFFSSVVSFWFTKQAFCIAMTYQTALLHTALQMRAHITFACCLVVVRLLAAGSCHCARAPTCSVNISANFTFNRNRKDATFYVVNVCISKLNFKPHVVV